MSFVYSVDGVLGLVFLVSKNVEGARRACGIHDELTTAVSSLHKILKFLHSEMSTPGSPVNVTKRSRRTEMRNLTTGCEPYIRAIDCVLTKYNTLSDEERSRRKLWQKVGFGSGEIQDLTEIRMKVSTYATAITMSLNLMKLGPRGMVERRLSHQKGHLEGIRESVNLILAQLNCTSPDASLMATYSKDSKTFWKSLRRGLVEDGYPRSALHGKKELILAYVKDLGARGVLDYSASRNSVATPIAPKQQPENSYTPAQLCAVPQTRSSTTSTPHSNSTGRTLVGSFGEGEESPVLWKEEYSAHSNPTVHSLAVRNKPLHYTPNTGFSPSLEKGNTSMDFPNTGSWHCSTAVNTPAHEKQSFIIPANVQSYLDTLRAAKTGGLPIPLSPYPAMNSTEESRVHCHEDADCREVLDSHVDDGQYDSITQQDDGITRPQVWGNTLEPVSKPTMQIRAPHVEHIRTSSFLNSSGEEFVLLESDASEEDQYPSLPSLFDLVQRGHCDFGPLDGCW
jgi:hypothetical protein